MFWAERTNRIAGITLLLLALGLIVSVAFSLALGDANPFERGEIEEFLQDINDNRGAAIVAAIADVTTDGVIGIAAAALLYLLFRDRSRLLALVGFALFFGGTIAFVAGDASNVALIVLAEDFAEKGGPEGIAAGDAVILEIARAVAIWGGTTFQIALTALGAGLISIGALIAWAERGALNPPRWLGWLAILAGVANVAGWLIALEEGFFVLFIVAIVAILLWLIILGIWLLVQPEAGEPASAT